MEVLQEVDKETIAEHIIEGLKEKKGQDIVCIDLTSVDNAICSYFIICHGDSSTQVNGMSQWVEFIVEEKLGQKVWHKQGIENSQWIILDYVDVVVHIFQKEFRDFYNLEGLWADGKISHYKNEYFVK